MKPSYLLSLLVFVLSALTSHAEALTRDLGQGLSYFRARTLPGDLPSPTPASNQCYVLDLRYTTGDASAAKALHAWLKFHASPRKPVFLLINSDTATTLLAPLASPRLSGLVVIGAGSAVITPDIAISTTAEVDRRAYDALGGSATPESLIIETPDKPRNDEAALMRDRDRVADAPTNTLASDDVTDAPPAAPAVKPKPPAALIDVALQRAVHLHRALKALKKL